MKKEKEIWKPVLNYEGIYEVSSWGRVRSLDRVTTYSDGRVYHRKGMIRTLGKDKDGYPTVSLYKQNTKLKTWTIHRLIAAVFFEFDGEYGYDVDHKDNNKTNNYIDNLQIITHRKNTSKDRNGGSSQYTGVSWVKRRKKWMSNIRIQGNSVFLCHSDDENFAALMYQGALKITDKYNGNKDVFRELVKSKIKAYAT